jgi:hypothetical protein
MYHRDEEKETEGLRQHGTSEDGRPEFCQSVRGARSTEACPVPLPWVLGRGGRKTERKEQGTTAVSEAEHTASYGVYLYK